MLFVFKWCQRWFISSSLRCSITASSWLARLLSNFLPLALRELKTSRWFSISCWISWNKTNKVHQIKYPMNERYQSIALTPWIYLFKQIQFCQQPEINMNITSILDWTCDKWFSQSAATIIPTVSGLLATGPSISIQFASTRKSMLIDFPVSHYETSCFLRQTFVRFLTSAPFLVYLHNST